MARKQAKRPPDVPRLDELDPLDAALIRALIDAQRSKPKR
jgi:hypothetical protein